MMIGSRRPVVNGIDPLAPLPMPVQPPVFSTEALPMVSGMGPELPPMQAPAKQGHKLNWGAIIADALSGLAGQQGQYPQRVARERAEQTEFERGEQRYQRQRADALSDWRTKEDYEAKNRVPTGFAGELIQAGYQPGTPEYTAKLQQYVTNRLDPQVTMPFGDGMFVGPRSAMPGAAGARPGPIAAPNVPPPQTAIEMLRSDPSKAGQFDEVFGPGAAAKILGGPASPAPGRFRP